MIGSPETEKCSIRGPVRASGLALSSAMRRAFPRAIADASVDEAGTRLGLDRGLAWKLQRLISEEDGLRAAYEAPSGPGLRKIVAAAGRLGVSSEAMDGVRSAVEAHARLVRDLPGGRHGLRALLSSELPEAKRAADQDARRQLVQGAAHLRGFGSDVIYQASILSPMGGEDPGIARSRIFVARGFKRLRDGPAFRIMATVMSPTDDREPTDAHHVSLSGARSADVDDYLLREFSSGFERELMLHVEGERCYLSCPPGVPEVNREIDFAFAQRAGRLGLRYATAGRSHEYLAQVVRVPTDLSIVDLWVHRDLGSPEVAPVVQQVMLSDIDVRRLPGSPDGITEVLDQPLEGEWLGMGYSMCSSRDVPSIRLIAEHVFEELGVDAEAYSLFRYRQTYPVPESVRVFWFPLARGGGDEAEGGSG